jgi:RNA polymerase sigma-70 factor (ECF subfamily)
VDSAEQKALEGLLQQILESSRSAWPEIRVEDDVFVRYLAERLAAFGSEPLKKKLERVHAADLYLACACSTGQEAAIAKFDSTVLPSTSGAVGGIDASPSFIEELQQQLRHKLFVSAEGKPPHIADYAGLGSLEQWLRSAAIRTALNVRKVAARERDCPPGGLEAGLLPVDPDLDLIKSKYRNDFEAAFRAALGALTRRDRILLRFSVVDQLSISQIGAIYHVDRSTVARWLAQARQQLLEDTKRGLKVRLKVSQSELHSLVALLQSQLNVSINRFLRAEGA